MTNLTARPDAGPGRRPQPAPRTTTAKTLALPAAATATPARAIARARRGQAGRRPADPVNEIVTSKTAAWL
jgi:hypothetical protein